MRYLFFALCILTAACSHPVTKPPAVTVGPPPTPQATPTPTPTPDPELMAFKQLLNSRDQEERIWALGSLLLNNTNGGGEYRVHLIEVTTENGDKRHRLVIHHTDLNEDCLECADLDKRKPPE